MKKFINIRSNFEQRIFFTKFNVIIRTGYKYFHISLINNTLYILGVNVIGTALGLVIWIITTRLYATYDVGIASSVFSTLQLLSGIANLGLGLGLIRFLSSSDEPVKLINYSISFISATSVIFGFIYLSGISFWSPKLSNIFSSPIYSFGFVCLLIFFSINSLLLSVFVAYRKSYFSFWQFSFTSISRLIFTALLLKLGALGIITSIGIGFFLGDCLAIFLFIPRVEKEFKLKFLFSKQIFKLLPYSIGSYIADNLFRLPVLIMPVLSLERLGASESSYAYIGWMIGWLLTSPGQSFASAIFAEGSYSPHRIILTIKKNFIKVFVFSAVLGAVAMVFTNLILSIFGKNYVSGASALLKVLTISTPFVVGNSLMYSMLRIRNRIGELIVLSTISASVTLIYSLFQIETTGIIAGGIGWLLAQLLILLILSRYLFENLEPIPVNE